MKDLGLLAEEKGCLRPANPIYAETVGRFLTRGSQQNVLMRRPDNIWVKDEGLDMPGLMAAFQQFWRENAEGWLVVADSDLTKPWDDKISSADIVEGDKAIHVICC